MLTMIRDRNRRLTIATDAPLDGRYLIDTECPQADIHRVIRPLTDDEDYVEVWERRRSDDAAIIEVAEGGRILWSL